MSELICVLMVLTYVCGMGSILFLVRENLINFHGIIIGVIFSLIWPMTYVIIATQMVSEILEEKRIHKQIRLLQLLETDSYEDAT